MTYWSKSNICVDPFASSPREPASLFGLINPKCESILQSDSGHFDPKLFEQHLAEFQKLNEKKSLNLTDVMGKPEAFLALLEAESTVREQKLQSFSEKMKDLSASDLKKLYKTILKSTRDGQITEYDLDKLLVRLYRITYRPSGIIRNGLDTRSMQLAFEKMDDAVIKERVALELYREGMIKAFDLVIKEPTFRTKFLSTLSRNRDWVDVGIATALWTSSVVLQMATGTNVLDVSNILGSLPPYLPSLKKFLGADFTEQDKNVFINKGPDAGYENMAKKYNGQLNKGRYWQYFRNTYLWTFSVLITATVSINAYENIQVQRQLENKAEYQSTTEMMNDYIEASKMTPEERGEADFKRFVAYCEANGLKVDINSAEMQAERKKRIAAYVEAAKHSKTSNNETTN